MQFVQISSNLQLQSTQSFNLVERNQIHFFLNRRFSSSHFLAKSSSWFEVQRVFQKWKRQSALLPVRRIKVPHFFVKSKFRTFFVSLKEFPWPDLPSRSSKGANNAFHLWESCYLNYLLCKWSELKIKCFKDVISTSANEPTFLDLIFYVAQGLPTLATN